VVDRFAIKKEAELGYFLPVSMVSLEIVFKQAYA
jgi:hypothetical protein